MTKTASDPSTLPAPFRNRAISYTGTILSLLGVIDATILTIAHFTTASVLACPATAFINCAKVTTSSFSSIIGIPVAILGLMFFVVMLVLQLPQTWKIRQPLVIWARLGMSIIGLGMVFWLVYVELFKLNAICLYCTGVHTLTFGLFIVTAIGTALITQQSGPKSNRLSADSHD